MRPEHAAGGHAVKPQAHWAPKPPIGAEPPRESLSTLLIGAAALVLWGVALWLLLRAAA